MRTNKCGVYEIRNTVNNHRYIGSSVNIPDRFRLHKRNLNNQTHDNPHLQSAWNKYGGEVFAFRALLYCDRDMTLFYEQACLNGMRTDYNITFNAYAPNLGRVWSAEVKAKMSKASQGKRHSEESRRKISAGNKGRKKSEEEIRKHAEAVRGIIPSEESRRKMSKAHKGVEFSEEHKAKIGAKTKERWSSDEYRQKISASVTGFVHSEETKQKMREAWERRRSKGQKV